MFMRRPLANAPFRSRNASGNVRTGAVTPPSTCISWKRCPFASASISIGGKTTGMLADAARTSLNKSSAWGDPIAAMRPISQITVRCVSRLVVTMRSLLPLGVFGGDRPKHVLADIAGNQLAQMRISKQARSEKSMHDAWRLEQAFSDAAGINVAQGSVVGRTEKCKRCDQSTCAHPRND